MKAFGQRSRLFILILYVGALVLTSKVVFYTWVPPTTEKGIWFYSGIAAVLLGNLLVTPFYTKPVDAISYAVAALIAMLSVTASTSMRGIDGLLWISTVSYLTFLILSGMVSIAFKDSPNSLLQKISRSLYVFCDRLGKPDYLFSIIFLYAVIVFHRNSSREYAILGLAWVTIVWLRPVELGLEAVLRIRAIWGHTGTLRRLGEIVGHEVPSIVLIRLDQGSQASFGDTIVVRGDDGCLGVALALDHVGYAGGPWVRALHLYLSSTSRTCLEHATPPEDKFQTLAYSTDVKDLGIGKIDDVAFVNRDKLVGLVAPETDVIRLRIEIVRTDVSLEEGRLVEVEIESKPVLYQIVNGLTKEEIIEQKNKRGYVRAEAKKIGSWNEKDGGFDVVRWIPRLNSPVFLIDTVALSTHREAVGHFPGTGYPVTMNTDSLVTHNTAILGILGVGKSFLALELIERMIAVGIKVICFDLTNQYALELEPYFKSSVEKRIMDWLKEAGPSGKSNVQQNVEEGGSAVQFKLRVLGVLRRFLHPKARGRLAIFNPAEFEVWRQDSKPFQGRASMATLTPTEVTRLFAESALETLQLQGMTDHAKCCLVFEEAHSLVPEWTAVASEGDKTATNGTAKAILQGRKYGLGCLIVTQRTANVTKSILNQCNTVFALRVFDATGMEFLKNYIGEEYAGILSTLEDRYAVVFGRASSCREPVLVRLNDRQDFLQAFRLVSA